MSTTLTEPDSTTPSVAAIPLAADVKSQRLPVFQAIAALLGTGTYAAEIPWSRLYMLDNRHGRGFRGAGLWIAMDGRLYANRVCHRDTAARLFQDLGLPTTGFDDENVARAAGHHIGGMLRIQVHERGVSVSMAGAISLAQFKTVERLLAEHPGNRLWWQIVDAYSGELLHPGPGVEGWIAYLNAHGDVYRT